MVFMLSVTCQNGLLFTSLFNGHFLLCRVVIRFQLTFCSLQKWRIFSTKVTKNPELSASMKVSKKARNPPFLQTAVGRSYFLFKFKFHVNNAFNFDFLKFNINWFIFLFTFSAISYNHNFL